MPALYIRDKFVDAVEFGSVSQQIRRKRRCSIHLGDRLFIYTDNRVRQRRRLRETRCDDVLSVFIDSNMSVILGSKVLDTTEKHELALANGYKSFKEMFDFFSSTGGFPFKGQLVKWM